MKRVMLGMLTPSSNTILEPLCCRMVAGLEEVSMHFSRFPVTEISLTDRAQGQFDLEPIIAAAKLLSHAKVDVIAWNGTSSGWLGFDSDERLCSEVTEATGIPTTTSVLALNEIFDKTGVTSFGLVTPYRNEVQGQIIKNYADRGYSCVAERHLDKSDNFSFSEVPLWQIAEMTREVSASQPQAISTFCTNLCAAPAADALERELGIPVLDSVAAAVWKSLSVAGVDTARVEGWGSLFQDLS